LAHNKWETLDIMFEILQTVPLKRFTQHLSILSNVSSAIPEIAPW